MARFVLVLALVAAGVQLGCSHDPPTAPKGPFTIRGHVRLTGYLVATDGHFAGTRVVDDADSVEVELRYGHASLARTLTTRGGYAFGGLSPGAYQVVANVIGDVADATTELTVVDRDLTSGDTLALSSLGDLYPVPNPSVEAVAVYFDVPDSADVDVRIVGLHGNVVQRLLSMRVQGLQQVLWTWHDEQMNLVTGPMYWITYEAGADKRAQLLFR
ncbi:MAG TPA: hypothetical protein VN896_01080 [Methylomirabilota bacterium]|jgi:hypothetical protein|nr:hypothetical protein [Methylomirabilota bacterium]